MQDVTFALHSRVGVGAFMRDLRDDIGIGICTHIHVHVRAYAYMQARGCMPFRPSRRWAFPRLSQEKIDRFFHEGIEALPALCRDLFQAFALAFFYQKLTCVVVRGVPSPSDLI